MVVRCYTGRYNHHPHPRVRFSNMGDKTKKQASKKSGKVVRFPERGQFTDQELHEILQHLLDSGHRRHVELYLIAWRDYFGKGS